MADDGLINPTYGDDGPEWDIAGYTDWSGEYHQLDEDFDYADLDFDDIDMVTIGWTDAENGNEQYANLVGPWDDLDELEDVVDTYFEEGTP